MNSAHSPAAGSSTRVGMNGDKRNSARAWFGHRRSCFQRYERIVFARVNHFRAQPCLQQLPRTLAPHSRTRSFSSRPLGPMVPVIVSSTAPDQSRSRRSSAPRLRISERSPPRRRPRPRERSKRQDRPAFASDASASPACCLDHHGFPRGRIRRIRRSALRPPQYSASPRDDDAPVSSSSASTIFFTICRRAGAARATVSDAEGVGIIAGARANRVLGPLPPRTAECLLRRPEHPCCEYSIDQAGTDWAAGRHRTRQISSTSSTTRVLPGANERRELSSESRHPRRRLLPTSVEASLVSRQVKPGRGAGPSASACDSKLHVAFQAQSQPASNPE